MERSIDIMAERIAHILKANMPSIMMYGSVVLDDFRLGWSDIDIVCVTNAVISNEQAHTLVGLRQTLMSEYEGNPYFRLFEGGLLTKAGLLSGGEDTVVYWGTSGQRVTDSYRLDPFARIELIERGRLLYGTDFRDMLAYPSAREVYDAVKRHYATIRAYGKSTNSILSVGWALDIARCLHTLETLQVISKTEAAQWALERGLSPDSNILERMIAIRKNPMAYKEDDDTKAWVSGLDSYIQRFADVLEDKLAHSPYITNS